MGCLADCQRNEKDAKTGKYNRLSLRRPTIIRWYNYGMGGTDLFDQLLSYYRTNVKSKRWHHNIIFHILLCCALNAWILFKLKYELAKHQSCGNFRTFLELLIVQMNDTPADAAPSSPQGSEDDVQNLYVTDIAPKKRKVDNISQDDARFCGDHTAVKVSIESSSGGRGRRRCARQGCLSKSTVICRQCTVALCIVDSENGTCFERYHDKKCYT